MSQIKLVQGGGPKRRRANAENLHLSAAAESDFAEIKDGFLPGRSKARCRSQPGTTETEGVSGIIVRNDKGSLMGAAFYRIEADQLSVLEFSSRFRNLEAGHLMAERLRHVAQELRLEFIRFLIEQDVDSRDFLIGSGFELLAYFQDDPNALDATRMEIWRLPRIRI